MLVERKDCNDSNHAIKIRQKGDAYNIVVDKSNNHKKESKEDEWIIVKDIKEYN